MKIIVNPKYDSIADFIRNIPQRGYACDSILKDGRNLIEKVTAGGGVTVAIKRFKKPGPINRFAYTFLRRSKARRSYDYAFDLLRLGIDTPEPVACMEIKKGGLIHTAYYISLFSEWPLIDTLEQYGEPDKTDIIDALAAFTAGMHAKGIVHKDYNTANILFHKDNGGYRFSLIDINRLRFYRKITKWREFKGLSRFEPAFPSYVRFCRKYAELTGWNEFSFTGLLFLNMGYRPYWRMKKALKSLVPFRRKK